MVASEGGGETVVSGAISDRVWRTLGEIADPELPITITDLGLVQSVAVDGGAVRVTLVPTFTGCPALDVIKDEVRRRLLAIPGVEAAEVAYTFEETWTLARMTEAGRARLAAHGLSVPRAHLGEPTVCPFCGSTHVALESLFGPTLCRATYYCRDCRNPIERFKSPAEPLPAPGR